MIYRAYTDLDLAKMIHSDDSEAFAELYRRYAMPLLNHAHNKLQCREAAKDIVQEVFTVLWTKRRDMVVSKNLSGFLYTSVRNKILNHIAHQGVADKYVESMVGFAHQGVPVADYLVREKQLTSLIESEISRLTPKMREVFELSRKEYLSHEAIAAKLGLSEQTVAKHITNALRILRKKLAFMFSLVLLFLL